MNSMKKNIIATNARKHRRIEKALGAKLCPLNGCGDALSGPESEFEFIATNLSEGGLCGDLGIAETALMNDLASLKGVFDIELRAPQIHKKIRLKAKPVWTGPPLDIINGRRLCGFQFDLISEAQSRIIRNIIKAYDKEDETPVPPLRQFKLLIGGQDVDTGVYEYFPYTEKCIENFKNAYKAILRIKKDPGSRLESEYIFARYCLGDEKSNLLAIEAARRAYLEYRNFPLDIRRKILGDIHDLLIEKKEEIVKLLIIEGHAKTLAEWEFLGMERAFDFRTLDFYASQIEKVFDSGDEKVFVVRKPDGVVTVSPPKNASCSNSLLAAFALLSGNTLIVKPPLKCPIATTYLWRNVIHEALRINHAPAGCVNIVVGNSKKIMDEWLESPWVNDIIYFGDSETGLEIGRQAYGKNKKAILELSGNDLFFVWKDADLDKSVDSFLDAFLGSTQICMVPKNAIIHEAAFERFTERLAEKVKDLCFGLPSDPRTHFTPVVRIADFFDFLKDAVSHGAKVLCGGHRVDHNGQVSAQGMFLQPTLLSIEDAREASKMRVFKEENFFPLIPLIKVIGKDDESIFCQMVALSDENFYGLRTSVWVKEDRWVNRFAAELHNTGLLKINSRHVGFSAYTSTHGGTGMTGGPYGEMTYMWQKTSHLQGVVLHRNKVANT